MAAAAQQNNQSAMPGAPLQDLTSSSAVQGIIAKDIIDILECCVCMEPFVYSQSMYYVHKHV